MRKMTEARVLIISNGHGEDQIAAVLGGKLAEVAPEVTIRALPLVGAGRAYAQYGIPVIMQAEELPSGGFARNSLRNLWMDVKGGLLGQIASQIQLLRKIRPEVDLAVCVGDVYLIMLAGMFLKKPVYFLPTAKSDYIRPHWRIEVSLMRRFCQRIFPRDARTARSLARQGLPAEFAGNLMMDCLSFRDPDYFRLEKDWVITLLPGSRREAYENMVDLTAALTALEELLAEQQGIAGTRRYLLALAGGLEVAVMAERLAPMDWRLVEPLPEEDAQGICGHLQGPREGLSIMVVKGRFADLLAASDLVLGLAGTGNEQAAGLGKPVVAFPGRGPQFSEKFAQMQKRLLGEAVSLVAREPRVVAQEILNILTNADRREQMGKVGRERMGEPGGAKAIALQIKEYFRQR